ncbi:DinB family protein [Paenibacillus septentrionalis]|uniref:DinB family protein n=1 Tax=Paenibacillus septentrionalis TaxID=429342 RepID=A0ABW1V8F7_9BACL
MDTVTIIAMWQATQARFHNMVKELPEEALSLAIGPASIGYMIRHSAEVEYVYADWVFGKSKPDALEYVTLRGPGHTTASFTNLAELVALLEASNAVIVEAIESLPAEDWTKEVKTPRGTFTPLDAIAQLMYHTGIHAGQISLIQKYA